MNFVDIIKEKIRKKINPENIILIDNSNLHIAHKSFDPKKVHLKLIIESKKLKGMNRVSAHKKIFSIIKDEIKDKIHALEIDIR